MRARWALGGLVLAAGVGMGAYSIGWNHVTLLRGEQMASGVMTQLRVDIGGLFHPSSVQAASGAKSSGAASADKSDLLSTGQGTGAATGAAGTTGTPSAGSGAAVSSGGVLGSSGAVGTASAASPGAGVSRTAPPITTNNAPSPTPTVLDGVKLLYDPYKPSDGPYPTLTSGEKVWIDVSIDQQLAYVMSGDHVLYTMVTSTGMDTKPDNSTPLGVYHIQSERGTWFYSTQYQMGAKYWVSWLGHGIFLFHSVPMNQNGQVLANVAAKLGHPASHGCFHLTIPDAQWVYNNIPQGTTVVVEQAPVALQSGEIYQPSVPQQAAEQGTATASPGPGAS